MKLLEYKGVKMTIEYTNQSWELFSGFYESELYNSDALSEMCEMMPEDENDDREYDITDWTGFTTETAQAICELWRDYLPNHDIIRDIRYIELWSPRYYNFTTDKISAWVDFDFDKLCDYCFKTHRDDFFKYLHENWDSRDGFISFIDTVNFEYEASKEHKKDDLEIMIEYYLLNELDLNNLQQEAYEKARDILWGYIGPVESEK